MTPPSDEIRTDAGLLLLALIWGVNFAVLKAILVELEPLALNALRFPLAALALAVALRRGGGGPAALRREDVPRVLGLAFLGHVLYQLAFIWGIDGTLAGNASLLLATTPIWALLLSAGLGHEETGPLLWGGVAVTVAGMSMVVVGRGDAVALGGNSLRGDLLMVIAAILWAVYTVGGRRPVARYGALRITAWTLWAGTPFVVLLGIPQLRATDWSALSPLVWAGVLYSGVFAIAVAYLLWYRGVRAIGASRTAAYSNLVPVAAFLTAWLWLGEVPSGLQMLGAAVILAGLTATRRARTPQLPEPSSRR